MIEILAIVWLSKKNSREALKRRHKPAGFIILTVALWIGMEAAGFFIGLKLGIEVLTYTWIAAYLTGLVFASIGSVISRIIVTRLKQGDYTPKGYDMSETGAQLLESPARITVVRREGGGTAPPEDWEIFLNGLSIGKIEDGAQVTGATSQRDNVLTARKPSGGEGRPFEVFVENGWHSEVLFEEGRFENVYRIDRQYKTAPGRAQKALK